MYKNICNSPNIFLIISYFESYMVRWHVIAHQVSCANNADGVMLVLHTKKLYLWYSSHNQVPRIKLQNAFVLYVESQ